MAETYRLGLHRFDGTTATYKKHQDNDPHQFVSVSIDRDKFFSLGRPGYVTVSVARADDDE